MPEGEKIGGGYVDVAANLSPFDAAMASLPKKAVAKMDAAMKSLQARMAQTKLDLKFAYNAGDLAAQQKLQPLLENLKVKIANVEAATIKQGQAARVEAAAAKAAAAEKIAAKAAENAAIKQASQVARAAAAQAKQDAREEAAARRSLAQQMRQDAREQFADQRRVAQQFAQAERARLGGGGKGKGGAVVDSGGMSGAMGLMMVSQVIDDMQYGFRAVVNQIPQLGMGLGAALGMSSDAAMKLGGAMGIAGVAINLVINNAGEWAESMGLFAEETKKSTDALEALAERIKVLEAKPIKLAIDTFEIDQAKKKLSELEAAAQAFKGMGETASAGEKASGEAVSQKFAGLGAAEGDKIQGGLKAKMAQELLSQSETVKEADREAARAQEIQKKAETRLQFAGSMGGQRQALEEVDSAKARVKAAQENAAKARLAITKEGGEAEREIGKIWSEATKGNVDAQKKLVARLQAIGQEKLASEIASVRPDLMGPAEEDPDIARTNEFNIGLQAQAKEAKAKQDAEDSRLAGAMKGSVGQKLLKTPGMDEEALKDEVRTAMVLSGSKSTEVDAAVDGVAKKLREAVEKDVAAKALGRDDHDPEKARAELLKEAQKKDDKGIMKPEVMGTGSYLNKLLVAGLSGQKDDVAKEQLKEIQTTNKKLDDVIKEVSKPQRAIPALVGPGR